MAAAAPARWYGWAADDGEPTRAAAAGEPAPGGMARGAGTAGEAGLLAGEATALLAGEAATAGGMALWAAASCSGNAEGGSAAA